VTANEALSLARELGVSRRDAVAIIKHLSGHSHAWLLAHADDTLTHPEDLPDALRQAMQQRADDVPIAYLLGHEEFMGLSLRVSPSVLVPRPDTQTLVLWAVDLLNSTWRTVPAPRVLDLGTGSGAIALALAQAVPNAQVHASDQSAAALDVARGNAQSLGLRVVFHEQPWWDGPLTPEMTSALTGMPGEAQDTGFHLVVSNPPYIAQGDPHLAALRHEPSSALVAGPLGMDDLQAIAQGAPGRLVPGGWLLLEHGHDQAQAVTKLLQELGFDDVQTRHDAGGRPRCTGGRFGPAAQAVK
jgi:release factor glutamine methyltransferase